MRETIRAAFVIGRRDFIATVGSRTFLLFLLGPLLPILFGGIFGAIGAAVDSPPVERSVAVLAAHAERTRIAAAQARVEAILGQGATPRLRYVAPGASPRALLRGKTPTSAVLQDPLGQPAVYSSEADWAAGRDGRRLRLIVDQARGEADTPPPTIRSIHLAVPIAPSDDRSREATARAGQAVLLVLTMILAGMLLSNLLEEKGSKVIEVLAAAVPAHAIFLGKLLAMLAMSLVGITVWSTAAVLGLIFLAPPGLVPPVPAIGWPGFVLLGLVYFSASYLLLGAVFLGIGAQASSVREVQTLSMPVTMSQLVVFGFASVAVGAPASGLALAASIFPLSSPLAMIARAAQSPAWWPHVIAILWQALWVVIIVRVAASRFRTSVLKSGSGKRRWRRRAA
jgi:ABC-2 type transport system permease protein